MPEAAFPILQPNASGPREYVPWAFVAPHEGQAQRNHYQSLQQLARRGGLSWCELRAVIEDRPWRRGVEAEDKAAVEAAIVKWRGPKSCGRCQWRDAEPFTLGDEDEPAKYLCNLPSDRLPLCMRGVPERERQLVAETATGCPTWAYRNA